MNLIINDSFLITELITNVNYFPGRRKSNAFLDVPVSNSNYLQVNDCDDDITIRTFSSSNKG